jgi:tRNA U55 pseudouridine synthase TruB
LSKTIHRLLNVAYAGRLDPMAHGVLILLVGNENKMRDKYEKLDKEYKFQCILGVGTDTYDILGIQINEREPIFFIFTQNITLINITLLGQIDRSTVNFSPLNELSPRLQTLVSQFVGSFEQSYPPFSSVRVKGKPVPISCNFFIYSQFFFV